MAFVRSYYHREKSELDEKKVKESVKNLQLNLRLVLRLATVCLNSIRFDEIVHGLLIGSVDNVLIFIDLSINFSLLG